MEYIKRELERKFLHMNSVFKAIMVTGARQVGKSTMLKKLAEKEKRTMVSMDDARARELARNDPKLFFQVYQPPILIDEVQKAPELFETIKMMFDESEESGRFWLTGSESKKLLKEAGESMAGRICILRMYSLSQREKSGLCAYLSMWTSRDTLMNGAASVHYFENNVVGEFMRTYEYSPEKVNMTFYRDTNQKEIDLVIEKEGKLHPIEIKRAFAPEKKAIKSFGILEKSSQEVSLGGIVCMTDEVFPIDAQNLYIPCNVI